MNASAPPRNGASLPLTYVDSEDLLAELCGYLGSVDRFGLDTEFVGERSYLPRLELVQVATEERCALLDCRALGDLRPFFRVLADPEVEKVLHSGRQDLELFHRLSGMVPDPVFDTQVAAAMAGYGAQPGYANLVERLFRVSLTKSERLTDWSSRPLTKAQIAYAADDVRYLLPLYECLRTRLCEMGRWEWLKEELRVLERSAAGAEIAPESAYRRVRGRGSLRPRGLAVLRELAAWREELAREKDKPRNSIVRDDVLVEIARRAPTTVEALRGLRAIRSRLLDKQAEEVVRRVHSALALPSEKWPRSGESRGSSTPPGLVEVLQGVVRARAEKARVAPSLLATNKDIQELVRRHSEGDMESLPLMQGWRGEIVGAELVALLDGCAVVDLKEHEVCVRRR